MIGVCFSLQVSMKSPQEDVSEVQCWSAELLLYSVFNIYTDTYTYTYIYIYTHVYMYIYIHIYVYVYVCVGTYMYKDGLRVHVNCSCLATFLYRLFWYWFLYRLFWYWFLYWLFWYWFLYRLFCALKSL